MNDETARTSYAAACRLLHLAEGAPLHVAEAAFRAMAKAAHPDAGGSNEAMAGVNGAIELIRASRAVPAPLPGCHRRPRACDVVLQAGKFRGTTLEAVPLSYLCWVAENWGGEVMRADAVRVIHWRVR
jgi:hypothetical protein